MSPLFFFILIHIQSLKTKDWHETVFLRKSWFLSKKHCRYKSPTGMIADEGENAVSCSGGWCWSDQSPMPRDGVLDSIVFPAWSGQGEKPLMTWLPKTFLILMMNFAASWRLSRPTPPRGPIASWRAIDIHRWRAWRCTRRSWEFWSLLSK